MEDNAALRALAVARTRPRSGPATPQCRHPVERITGPHGFPTPEAIARKTTRMIEKGHDPTLCSHTSSHTVHGRHYCGLHAAMVALDLLIVAGHAKALDDATP